MPRAAIKRAMDVVGALALLPVVVPVVSLAALLIKVDSRGSILFVQERAGKGGKPFKMFKLRTMVEHAEALREQRVDFDAPQEPVSKLPGDPRITRVGRFLRRWSVDELPQLLNVLRGEMSLVGPRPEESRIVAKYSGRYRKRLTVKPGITGPMQVNGRGDLSFEERCRLEIEYVERYTLRQDVIILLKTIPAVISGKGAY